MSMRILFWFIVLANLGGAAFGLFYYSGQLAATNPMLWGLVLDCPTFAFMFALAFLFGAEPRPPSLTTIVRKIPAIRGRRLRRIPDLSFFWFFAMAGAMKYGFWTVFVLMTYSGFYFTPASGFMYSVLFVAHLFMLFETMLLVGRASLRRLFLPVVLASLLVNDLSDYLLGTHPPLPQHALAFMFPATVAMSFAFTLLAYAILARHPGPG